LKTAEFDYALPEELIAQSPASRRDDSRLLVVDRRSRAIEHRRFRDLPGYLRAGDCLIRNTARVIPARLLARRPGGGAVECLLLRPHDAARHQWWCLLRPGRKLPPGSSFCVPGEFEATVREKSPAAEYRIEFRPTRSPHDTVLDLAERLGRVPLPPYIHREAAPPGASETSPAAVDDAARYQTVFADAAHTVAVAAPTAGLHFTTGLLADIAARDVDFADVVLHVGLGTFRPIETEEVEDHPIHREVVEVAPAARAALVRPRAGRRIAVGTTSVRTVEYFAAHDLLAPRADQAESTLVAEADLFIHPPFRFRCVEALLTNFHLPRSTLLCLVAAFLTPGSTEGVAWLREIYAEAAREHYRFLSYGDAMLIL
jgi:S-adenosylmethionine:tRNA ribosyltransferase-isomerase